MCCLLLTLVVNFQASAQTKMGSESTHYSFEPFNLVVVSFVASAFYLLFIKKNSGR